MSIPFLSFLFSFVLSYNIDLSAGMKGGGGELGHLAGLPGGGAGIRYCHTVVRVHTV